MRRVVRIMTQGLAGKLSVGSKLMLAAFGGAVIVGPVLLGLLRAPQAQAQSRETAAASSATFDVASIKPNKSGADFAKFLYTPAGMSVENLTVHTLIRSAYELQDTQIVGEAAWVNSEKYDIEAKVDPAAAGPHYPISERRAALQRLLADRCKLKLHWETREIPVYELVIDKKGAKIKASKPGDTYVDGFKRNDGRPQGPGLWMRGRGNLTSQGMELSQLLRILSRSVDRPILDKTDLKGNYDYTLNWAPDDSPASALKNTDSGQPVALPETSSPSLFVAIQEQLGLKLESKKGPMEVLVIDHVEKPSEN